MLDLNEKQETVRFNIMINPLNRMAIMDAAKIVNNKIKSVSDILGIKNDGQPLMGIIWGLINNESEALSVKEKAYLQVRMYFDALHDVEKLEP